MHNKLKVWDPLVRLFHWSLVVAFTVAYISAEEENDIHIYAGYVVAGLILFRILWGFVGSPHARFSDFVTSPSSTWAYLKAISSKSKRYIGHNPAGGWMLLIMLLTLSIVTLSGFKIYAIEEGKGPFASENLPAIQMTSEAYADNDRYDDDSDDGEYRYRKYDDHDDEEEEFWEEIHEASSNFMILLILLHIAGVIIMGRLHDENLIKAMLTGYKKDDTSS